MGGLEAAERPDRDNAWPDLLGNGRQRILQLLDPHQIGGGGLGRNPPGKHAGQCNRNDDA